MDLRLHLQVIWRWRFVVVGGFALAIVLTFLSVFRVGLAHGLSISYRQGKTWQSTETLLLTQHGCSYCAVTGGPGPGATTDLNAFSSVYAQLANSDVIRTKVFPSGRATPATGDYVVSPVVDAFTQGQVLPFLQINGQASSAQQSAWIARRAASAFLAFLSNQSNIAGIKPSLRVVVQIVSPASASGAKVVKGRKLTIPIVIFLTVLVATLGLIYLLENLMPRVGAADRAASGNLARQVGVVRAGTDSGLEPLELPESEPAVGSVESPRPRRRAAGGAKTTPRRT